jgi:hypothetical protein
MTEPYKLDPARHEAIYTEEIASYYLPIHLRSKRA